MPAPPRKVLIVDDDPAIAGVAARVLEVRGGCQVTCVGSGEEALECVGDLAPDVVLLDIKMPGMDGLETLARLRADHGHVHAPVIAFTSCATDADCRRYRAAGALGTIAKPFDPGTLHEEVARLLAGI